MIQTLLLYTHEDVSAPEQVASAVIEKLNRDPSLFAISMAEWYDVKYGHVAVMEDGKCVNKIEIGGY